MSKPNPVKMAEEQAKSKQDEKEKAQSECAREVQEVLARHGCHLEVGQIVVVANQTKDEPAS